MERRAKKIEDGEEKGEDECSCDKENDEKSNKTDKE